MKTITYRTEIISTESTAVEAGVSRGMTTGTQMRSEPKRHVVVMTTTHPVTKVKP
jgi:hypothetical protein